VLDLPGAERLLGRGDMLYLPPDESKPSRVQGAFIDDEVKSIVDHWKAVSPDPGYDPEWLNLPSSGKGADSSGGGGEFELDEDEPLYQQALDVVRAQGTASASMLQRRLRVGYNRAARMIEQMEEEGVIGPADGAKGRPVLVNFETPDLG
jgi:S-DNA-T family DNA segregation ATPase FtsK/SpoIIIE